MTSWCLFFVLGPPAYRVDSRARQDLRQETDREATSPVQARQGVDWFLRCRYECREEVDGNQEKLFYQEAIEKEVIDLKDQQERGRLLKAVETSMRSFDVFRTVHAEFIKDYVGSWYSERGATFDTIVNLINQAARVYARILAANNPRVNITTHRPHLWSFASRYEIGINRLICDMKLDEKFRSIILDAFFCIGVARVCMADRGQVEIERDVFYDPGQPWVERISLDNLILDMSANELSKMRFAGDRYRASWEKVKSERSYDKKVVAQLAPTSKHTVEEGSERADEIASGSAVDDDELEPMIWLMNVWIPENKSVATMAVGKDLPPLKERKWKGAQGGPYKYLVLGHVPDNVIPSSPASNLKPLHDFYNKLMRKIRENAEIWKVVPTFPPGEEDQAKRLQGAKTGVWTQARSPEQMKVFEIGGINAEMFAFALGLEDRFDRMAGNLRAMGGLGTQAETLGQEEIIQQNVSGQAADFQFQVVKFAAEIATDLGYMMWNDGFLKIPSSIEVPGTGVHVDSSWNPDYRLGAFNEYDFKVEPYSMVYQTPTQKVQKVYRVLQRIAPLWPMFQAAGATIDVEELLSLIGEYEDLPEIQRIVSFAIEQQQMGTQHEATQAPMTQRENIRRNIPTGGTAESRNGILQQVLMGGGQTTPSQRQSMTRVPA